MSDAEVKEHHYIQKHPYTFHCTTYAPVTVKDPITGQSTKGPGRFSIDVKSSFGDDTLDLEDLMNSGNPLIVAFLGRIRWYEAMGYEHVGLPSGKITAMLDNLWGRGPWSSTK